MNFNLNLKARSVPQNISKMGVNVKLINIGFGEDL